MFKIFCVSTYLHHLMWGCLLMVVSTIPTHIFWSGCVVAHMHGPAIFTTIRHRLYMLQSLIILTCIVDFLLLSCYLAITSHIIVRSFFPSMFVAVIQDVPPWLCFSLVRMHRGSGQQREQYYIIILYNTASEIDTINCTESIAAIEDSRRMQGSLL